MTQKPRVPEVPIESNSVYDEAYYRSALGPMPYQREATWLGFFAGVADQLVRTFAPKTAIDVGCAMGMLVESLWDRGVTTDGVDVSAYALSCVRPDIRAHCRYGSIVNGVEGRYDLVICIEVLEHIPPDDTEAAVRALCRLGDSIVFSSSPTDFDEPTHVNVRPPLDWIRLFGANGFRVNLAADASFIAPHVIVFGRADGYADGDVERFVARTIGLRSAHADGDARNGELQRALDEARLGAAEAREAQTKAKLRADELCTALRAAETEREDVRDRLRRCMRDRERMRNEVAAFQESIAALRADVNTERERTEHQKMRAARVAEEVERLRNLRLLDNVERGEGAAALSRLRDLEQRYARLSEAYAARAAV